MLTIGLTGSIGMGKSTTAGFFREAGIPVYDADADVHALYQSEAVAPIEAAFPGVTHDGVIDRKILLEQLQKEPHGFSRLEKIVHPLVRQRQEDFLLNQRLAGAPLAVLDIPLLFEAGAEERVDVIVVVSADPQVQHDRVLARPGMSEEKYEMIRLRQMPDEEKRRRADFIIDTGKGLEAAKLAVFSLVAELKARAAKGETGIA